MREKLKSLVGSDLSASHFILYLILLFHNLLFDFCVMLNVGGHNDSEDGCYKAMDC